MQEDTGRYKELQEFTRGYKGFQGVKEVTGGYKRLYGVTVSYKRFQFVTMGT